MKSMTPYFQDENVTIYNMDSMTYFEESPPQLFDSVVADPPYQLNTKSAAMGKLNPWADLINSARFFRDVFSGSRDRLKPTGTAWYCLNWRSMASYQKAAFDSGWDISSVLIWNKDHPGLGQPYQLRYSYEMIALLSMPDAFINRSIKDIVTIPFSGRKPHGHPAEKPLELMEFLVCNGSPEGGVVLDPFCGSGTTLEAAVNLGRTAVGVEIDESWCEVAAKRIQKMGRG